VLRPLGERNGSRERAAAADKDEWVAVKAANSKDFSYWFPPEIAYLAVDGTPWNVLEEILRSALAARAVAGRDIKSKLSPPTGREAESSLAAFAVVYYHLLHHGALEEYPRSGLAAKLISYAERQGLPFADQLDNRVLDEVLKVALTVETLPDPPPDESVR